MKTGVELIAEERDEQIDKHNWTAKHDWQHDGGELAIAAVILASPYITYVKKEYANIFHFEANTIDWDLDVPMNGNVILDNSTYGKKKRIKQLAAAGALIAAEIDRLNNGGLI